VEKLDGVISSKLRALYGDVVGEWPAARGDGAREDTERRIHRPIHMGSRWGSEKHMRETRAARKEQEK
jgi:hypothetical protein